MSRDQTMRAEVIAVGSEMLTPTHVDTNSLFITERLNELGIDLQGKGIAGDDREVLKTIVSDALGRSDLLILTGGLGPTDDDLTREVVADLIGRPLEYQADIFEAIEMRFTARGLRTPEINRRQAMVPKGAAVLPNRNGTAPGLWIEHEQKLIVLLPGPPRELKPMFEAVIQERLLGHVGASRLFRRVLRITGQTESYVEEKMQPLYAKWLSASTRVTTTILASLGQIELHLTALASSADDGHRALDGAAADVREALGRDLFSTNGETLQQIVGELLRSRGLTHCRRRVVHRRARDGSPDRGARQLRLRGSRSRRVQQSVEDRSPRRAFLIDSRSRSRQRARRGSDGQRDGPQRRHRCRRRHYWRSGAGRGNTGETGGYGRDCRRLDAQRNHRHARADVQLRRRPGDGEISGVAGGARHGEAVGDGVAPASRGKRLFIAVDIDEPTREQVDRISMGLREAFGHTKASWVRPDRMHLTLQFFG